MNEGSYGGRHGKDAMDSVDNLMVNTRNNPIEELDMRFPMRCERYELRPEPAAPGKWRGGIGIIRHNRFLVDGIYSCEGDRQTDPPRGHLRRLGRPRRPPAARTRTRPPRSCCPRRSPASRSRPGDVHRVREPNAAGYGDPLERDPAQVREDVLDDFTTIELARDAYGVVFADEQTLEIDTAATEAQRRRAAGCRRGPVADRVLPGPADPVQRAGVDRVQCGVRDGGEMTTPLRPVERASDSMSVRRVRKAYEQVADQLRDLIVSGGSREGERLPNETVLAREFGVSRATVREALRLLTAQSLIRTAKGAGGGTYVTMPTVDHVSEFLNSSSGCSPHAET